MTPFVTCRAVAAMLAWLLASAVAPWPGGPVHTGANEPVKPRREVPGNIGTVAPGPSTRRVGWINWRRSSLSNGAWPGLGAKPDRTMRMSVRSCWCEACTSGASGAGPSRR